MVDTFEPPTMASIGRTGSCRDFPRVSNSLLSKGPAQARRAARTTPSVDAWARWAVPNASMTYTSHKPAMVRARVSSLLVSPRLNLTFSQRTTWPASTSTPSSQPDFKLTSIPNNSLRRAATGCRENCSSNSPSTGRPRCDKSNTAAPFSRAIRRVGKAALILASEVICPSLTGTLKSSRIMTRLPARSRFSIRR